MKYKKHLRHFFIVLALSTILFYISIGFKNNKNIVYAASTSFNSDLQLLARVINAEAGEESYEGQVATGAVILNRVNHSAFPNTIAGVIYEYSAFSAVMDRKINAEVSSNSTAIKAAADALNGWDPTNGSIYYFNPTTDTNEWIWSRPVVTEIGKYRFCK